MNLNLKEVAKELLKHAIYEHIIIFLGIIFVAASSFFTSKLLAEYIEALKNYLPYLIVMFTRGRSQLSQIMQATKLSMA